jgi:hypothetical protein
VPALRLGPLLRHVGVDDATVWVKTDAPRELEGRHARMRLEKAVGEASARPQLECVMDEPLA